MRLSDGRESDGREVSVLDRDCELRECLWVRDDPGTFVQGRGYRRDGPGRGLLCGRREAHGCPSPLPAPSAEKVRCCIAPTFLAPRKGARPSWQACRICGTRHVGRRLELARTLSRAPAVPCKHEHAEQVDWIGEVAWRCRDGYAAETRTSWRGCNAWWDTKPEAHAPGEALETFSARRHAAWLAGVDARRAGAPS